MKKIITLVVLLSCVHMAVSQQLYHRVKIYTPDNSIQKLGALGIEIDHGDIRPGVWLVTDLSEQELQTVKNNGFDTEIMIHNVKQFYMDQNESASFPSQKINAASCNNSSSPTYPAPANFSLGTMGGYFTYQEMLDNLDSMAAAYPSLITIRQPIGSGTTIEGRPIYYVKISDNANFDESEPEMLYTSLHHAREPGGMAQLIYYMWYLLENYGSDPELTYIVDETELFFVTCVNPDGYLFNEATDPNGGGMWRKNRRLNPGGSMGVDLNRNYGYNWGFDNSGSSPTGSDETYRGTAPFSEPETQLIQDFVNSRQFQIALNYHTFGNLLIYPWGYDYNIYTPDSALFVSYGELLTTYNSYTFGTGNQTVGYIVNGSSDDWMYGEQTAKPKIFSMTPEAGDGSFGFWPPSSQIVDICQDNMYQNITAALLLGPYAKVNETSASLFASNTEYSYYSITQLGLDTTGSYTVTMNPVTPNIIFTGTAKNYSGLTLMQQVLDSIEFQVTPSINYGDLVTYTISLDNGVFTRTDTINRIFGAPVTVFSNSGNSLSGWNPGQWGLSSSIFLSPPSSITDSPIGNYSDNTTNTLQLTTGIDLSNALIAKLRFHARWEIEPGYDYVLVQATDNNGTSWTSLCGKYTKTGSSFQVSGEPLYDGFQTSWVEEEIDLGMFAGSSNLMIRFLLASDAWLNYDGFYFDDMNVQIITPSTTSINENNGLAFYIYPNPASNNVNVSLGKPAGNKDLIRIIDITGRQIFVKELTPSTNLITLKTTELSKGVYFVEYDRDGLTKTKKLIVE